MSSYAFANPLPWWGVALAFAACATVAWFAYARLPVPPIRRTLLIALRCLTLMLLVVCLMRPVRTGDEGLRDMVVPVLVDVSRSMNLADAGEGATRIDRARDLLTRDLLPALKRHFQVELLSFGDGIAPAKPDTLDAKAWRSDLAGGVAAARERYRGRPVAGMVVISDGGDTGGGAVPDDTPVYAIGVGSPAIARDREVLGVTVAEAVFDDARVDLAVSAVRHGHGLGPVPLQRRVTVDQGPDPRSRLSWRRRLRPERQAQVRRRLEHDDGVPAPRGAQPRSEATTPARPATTTSRAGPGPARHRP